MLTILSSICIQSTLYRNNCVRLSGLASFKIFKRSNLMVTIMIKLLSGRTPTISISFDVHPIMQATVCRRESSDVYFSISSTTCKYTLGFSAIFCFMNNIIKYIFIVLVPLKSNYVNKYLGLWNLQNNIRLDGLFLRIQSTFLQDLDD